METRIKKNDIPSSSHSPPINEETGLGRVGENFDILNHPELQGAEVVAESDAVQEIRIVQCSVQEATTFIVTPKTL